MRFGRAESTASILAYLGAAVALGYAIQLANGSWTPEAIRLLAAGLLLIAVGVGSPASAWLEERRGWVLPLAFAGALGFQLVTLVSFFPSSYLQLKPGHGLVPLLRLLSLLALVAGAALASPAGRWAKPLVVLALVGLHLAAGAWILQNAPNPWVDVDYFHRSAVQALLRGESPYAQTIPNIYGHGVFYGEGMVRNGRVLIGYPYPPLSLLFSLPTAVVLGDHRYSGLLAMGGAAALLSFARPGYLGVWAAAVLLTTPRTFFILEHAWTEPFLVLLLALVVFAAARAPQRLAWPVALLLSIKQYLVLAVPALLLAVPRDGFSARVRRIALVSLAVGLALILPFLLWSPRAFVNDVFLAQLHQPFRTDALSFLADWAQRTGHQLSPGWAVVAVVLGYGWSAWRAPRSPAGAAGAFALTYCLFFAFNKQAFSNYYYLVIGALCCAAALTSAGAASSSPEAPPAASPGPPHAAS